MALDDAATSAGVEVVRMDFPYRRAGRRRPDRQAVLVEAVGAEALTLAARCDRLLLGGRSMGGRICSIAVAEGLPAEGLVLVSYPLHPPGRPTCLRSAHFAALDVPCLFVSGTRDAFATQDELESATAAIPGGVTHRWVEGKDHALRGSDAAVVEAFLGWLGELRQGDQASPAAASQAQDQDPSSSA